MARIEQEVGNNNKSATKSDDSKDNIDMENHDANINHDEDLPSPSDSAIFSKGERVLAYHAGRIYESKVREIRFQEKEWKYFVHYLGWKPKWDEWVNIDCLMKLTEENLQKKIDDDEKHGIEISKKTGRITWQSKPKNSTVASGKKRKHDYVVKEETTRLEKLVNIQIPTSLKKQLVDDCEFIVNLGKLVKLPRSPNVDDILNKYVDYRLENGTSVGEIFKGLRCYFDKALPAMLLYKNEREQYQKAVGDQISPSTVYGAEHLLRLFVKLPELLFRANIDQETLTELQQKLFDFLKFLQKNQATFFLSSYHIAEDQND